MLVFQRDILPYLQQGAGRQRPNAKLLHSYYQKSIQHRDEIEQVFGDEYPKYLDKDRPRELPEHKKYRKSVYENVFRGFKNRITSSLDYVRQADDFAVEFPSTAVDETESLETYTGKSYSAEGSLIEWFFANVKSDYVDDPNAVLLVLPTEPTLSDTEYPRPVTMIIPSENVWAFRRGEFAVLVSPEKILLPSDIEDNPTGNILYFVDHDSYAIARQTGLNTNAEGQTMADWSILGMELLLDETGNQIGQYFQPALHYCSTLPARKLGLRRTKKNGKKEEFYESLVADSLPHIRLGQRNQSDIQVETNFHVASQEWRRSTSKCKAPGCVGGLIHVRDDAQGQKTGIPGAIIDVQECLHCKGTGYHQSGGGMGIIWVDGAEGGTTPTDLGNKVLPGAPGGFIPRPIEGLKTFVDEFNRNAGEAFTTINMQFVRTSPYDDKSGIAKLYDREEMYRQLNTEGAHLIDLLSFGFECIDAQRFGPSGRAGEQLPDIPVPIRFNLENAELTRLELNDAKDKKYDSTLIEAYESKMLEYVTGEGSDEFQRYKLRKRLDPYKDVTDEMKAFMLGIQFRNPESPQQTAAIERLYYSMHFDGLVSDCLRDEPDFWQKDLQSQHKELEQRNKELVGPQTVGMQVAGSTGGAFPTLDSLTLKPLVDMQQQNQVLQNK
jgi:hypothetical protein